MILRKSFRGFCLSASCAACSTFEPCVVLSSEIKLHADLCVDLHRHNSKGSSRDVNGLQEGERKGGNIVLTSVQYLYHHHHHK